MDLNSGNKSNPAEANKEKKSTDVESKEGAGEETQERDKKDGIRDYKGANSLDK